MAGDLDGTTRFHGDTLERRRRHENPAAAPTAPPRVTLQHMATGAADARTVLAELEAADRLLVQQVFKPIANEYRISVPAPGSTEEGRAAALREAEEDEDQGGHPLPRSRPTTTSTCS